MDELDETTLVGWVTLGEAETLWADAPLDLDERALYLRAAHAQCVAFLNESATYSATPEYKLAQVMQARALLRSNAAGSGDRLGPDGFSVTVFPMDWTVKALLRPKHGKPVFA